MRVGSAFLEHYRSAGDSPAQLERVLAVGRALLTVSACIAIYLDPTEPRRFQATAYGILFAYAMCSVAVLMYVHRSGEPTAFLARLLYGFDIAFASALTFVSEGPVSPFFLFFLFVVVAAAYRGGFTHTIRTAFIVVVVFLAQTAVAAGGPWSSTVFESVPFELNVILTRVTYLVLTGVLVGYLAEQQKQSTAELAAIADVTRQPRVNLGLGGSVNAVGRMLCSTFGARSVVIVLYDQDSGRTLHWHIDKTDLPSRTLHARRRELNTEEQAMWLFPDFGRAWYAIVDAAKQSAVIRVRSTGAGGLTRQYAELPSSLIANPECRTVTAVNMGLSAEWHGRIYLFDVSEGYPAERSLRFLESLADHVSPALTNVLLLRRLRARAGAVERARVARELHDGAIQALFGIEMKLEAFRRAPDRSPAFVDEEVKEIQEQLRREALSLRELMQALRPIELEGADQLPHVLAALVERFRRDTGIMARFVVTGGEIALPPSTAVELVRIVQEALANVRRHSHAQNVLVSLTSEHAVCRLVIEDDGAGFNFEGRLSASELDRRRLGPAIIKERARLAGAQLAVDSTPGAGARLELAFNAEAAHG